jgi:hypothetical protein
MKRRVTFTDEDVRSMWSGSGWAEQLEEDHLQAREDVKRLALRLREVTVDGHEPACPRLQGHAPKVGAGCCATGVLLSEVGQ